MLFYIVFVVLIKLVTSVNVASLDIGKACALPCAAAVLTTSLIFVKYSVVLLIGVIS